MLGLMALWIILQGIQWDSNWSRMDDDAAYILHARSLVENKQYNDPNFVYSPRAHYVPLSTMPGWPLMLTPLVAIFGVHLGVMKILVVLMAAALGGVVYRLVQDQLEDNRISLLITGCILFSMTTIVFSRVIYSEWPYMLLSTGFIVLFLRRDERQDFSFWAAMGVLLGVTILLRSVAYALVGAAVLMLGIEWIRHRDRRQSILKNSFVLVITAVIVSQAATMVVRPQKGSGYTEQFLVRDLTYPDDGQATVMDIGKRIYQNGRAVVAKMVPVMMGRTWHEGLMQIHPRVRDGVEGGLFILGGILSLVCLAGFIRRLVERPTILEPYVVLFLGMNALFWLYTEVYRYLMPIVPFLLFYFWHGSQWILEKVRVDESKRRVILQGALSALLVVNVAQASVEVVRYRWSSPENGGVSMAPYMEAVQYLKEYVAEDELIIADDSRWWALEVSKPVTTYLSTRDRDKGYRYIADIPKSVIVVDSKRPQQRTGLIPVIAARPENFVHIKSIGHIEIYRHQKEIPPKESEESS